MNTTTAIQRNILLTPQDIRLPAGGMFPTCHDTPMHDFLVLNQRPDLTPGPFPQPGAAAPQKT